MLLPEFQQIAEAAKRADNSAYALIEKLDLRRFEKFEIIKAATTSKEWAFDKGGLEVAERLLLDLLSIHPDYSVALYELAIVYRYKLNLNLSLNFIERAFALEENDDRISLYYLNMLYSQRRFIEADKLYERISVRYRGDRNELMAMRDFGAYLKQFPVEAARALNENIRANHYWASPREVADLAVSAIREKRPFALIRLGDGEGAFVKLSEADETEYVNLYGWYREYWIDFLLGKHVDPVFIGYTGLTSKLMDFSLEADVLGAPYTEWIDYEYAICSMRTIPCLVNISRYLGDFRKVKHITLCGQDIHLQLRRGNHYHDILSGVPSATVISCIEGVDRKVSEMFGIPDVSLIRVPSESYAPHLGRVHTDYKPGHFPAVFWQIVDRLSVPHEGRVFLIAAGTFGKFYAAIIKRHGGVALDLGSIVDGWMKLASRPFYAQEFDIAS